MAKRQTELALPQPAHPAPVGRWFYLLLLLTALVRLVGIARPLLGHFATKNVVYAMIARNWASGQASLWHPTLDCLAGGQRAWHLLEVPVSAYLAGGLWALLGGSLDVWGRLVSVGFSTLSVALLFLLVDRWHGRAAAWPAAVALALAPVSIIYGQAFMLEASVVCLTLASVWSLDTYLRRGRKGWLWLAAGCLALLLLTKIYMLVLLPVLVGMVFGARGWPVLAGASSRGGLLLAVALAVLPAVAWCGHVWTISAPGEPDAERIFYSLRDSTGDHGWPHPLLFSADFYRGLLDNLAGIALTPVGLVLALVGLARRNCRRNWPWLACMAILWLLLPRKFHEMNYYYLVILPPWCVAVGLGWQYLAERLRPSRLAVAGVLLAAALFSLRHAARPAFVTPAEDRMVLAAAAELRSLCGPNEPVVTMHGSTIDLLYYCDRTGWNLESDDPRFEARLAEYTQQGARWLVIAEADGEPWELPRLPLDAATLRSAPVDAHFRIWSLGDDSLAERDPRDKDRR